MYLTYCHKPVVRADTLLVRLEFIISFYLIVAQGVYTSKLPVTGKALEVVTRIAN